ncbi:hypothetical protein OS493_011932 [Desmophyllum pertusum]|uniref:Uncharacterized protein n=1 Tax=Desmophyllum pertusum TaxID=174260 RepID=A0A9X0CFY1_9CNID|nr:hypothetical protein OS493_011932 [Desmophyllum pertusum]
MDAYRLLFLVAICGACVILQFSLAKSEENTQDRETDPDFQGLNIREKRSFRRCRYRCGYNLGLGGGSFGLGGVHLPILKGVDCQNNSRCAKRQERAYFNSYNFDVDYSHDVDESF